MSESRFIAKTPQLEPSQDYAFLRSEGLRHVEALARELWTDYNVHDPGITLLEQLCYAITELGYRTGNDVADLLTEIEGGVPVNNADFHTARYALTNHPVSFDDLRKLLVDVTGVRNAWIEKNTSVEYHLDRAAGELTDAESTDTEPVPLGGLYDVYVEYDDTVEAEPRRARLGPDATLDDVANYIQPGGRGIRFDVEYEMVLLAVHLYPESAGSVTVRLEDADSVVIEELDVMLQLAGAKNRVELGWRIPPGTGYQLRATGADLYRTPTAGAAYPYSLERLVHLQGGVGGGGYFFFYDWELTYAVASDTADTLDCPELPPGPSTTVTTRDDVRLAILDRLHSHRNLCEDFVDLRDLEKEEIALCADIELEPEADVEEVLAEIFYQLELHVSPALRFYSIDELAERGHGTDEIFEGPPLCHGFLDEEELRELRRRCEIRTSDVMRIVMGVEGVAAVRHMTLLSFLDGELRAHEQWLLPLATDRFRAPELATERSKVLFYKHDLPYFANSPTVEDILAEKRAAQLGSKLAGQDMDLPVPAGRFLDVGRYDPIQNELPAVYAVGRTRLAASRSKLRHAQSHQLKAYLMIFEQLLANHQAQLSHVRELFSWSEAGGSSYFTQEVSGIAGLGELFDQEYLDDEHSGSLAKALAAIIEDEDTAAARKGAFLDHLLGRFAEDMTDYGRLMTTLDEDGGRKRLLDDKRELLADHPKATGNRGRGHDVREPDSEANLCGYARRVYRLLGIRDVRRRQLAGHRFEIRDTAEGFRFALRNETDDGDLFVSEPCDSQAGAEALLDFVLDFGGDEANYRDEENVWKLGILCPGETEHRELGATTSNALNVLKEVVAYIQAYGDGAEGFHVVEHVLLRRRTSNDPFLPVQIGEGEGHCPEVADPYSFRATVVLPAWPSRFRDARFRRFVEETLRREAPAHVWLKVVWIGHQQMKSFEERYMAWQRLLADGGAAASDGTALAELIDALAGLITVHPLARLHDCQESDGSAPQITLNRTNLGTS